MTILSKLHLQLLFLHKYVIVFFIPKCQCIPQRIPFKEKGSLFLCWSLSCLAVLAWCLLVKTKHLQVKLSISQTMTSECSAVLKWTMPRRGGNWCGQNTEQLDMDMWIQQRALRLVKNGLRLYPYSQWNAAECRALYISFCESPLSFFSDIYIYIYI